MNHYQEYAEFLKKFVSVASPIRVVFDSSDGATGPVLHELFTTHQLINSILINSKPNGEFPAHGPNPLARGAQKDLRIVVKKNNADLGVIFDADGDRVFFIDNEGREIRSDIAALLMSEVFQGPFVFDIRAGYALRDRLDETKKKAIYSRVGHVFMKRAMREHGAEFGGELSGHFYFKDFFFADSGIVAALTMIRIVSQLVQNESSLAARLDSIPATYYSGEVSITVSRNDSAIERVVSAFQAVAEHVDHTDGVRIDAKDFWISVRASNTEPVIRFVLEAREKSVFNRELKKLKEAIGTAN